MVSLIRSVRLGLLPTLLVLPVSVSAQATTYVPVDDIAYVYVDALMSRGYLRNLSVLARPYTASAIRAGTDTAIADDASEPLRQTIESLRTALLRYELRKPDEAADERLPFRAKATFDVYVNAQTSARRELMLADSRDDVTPGIAGYFVMAGGHLAGSVRALLDTRLDVDPEFIGKQDRALAGRTEDGYLSGQWKWAEVTFGRVARNWGPTVMQGLQLGTAPYTYDHLFARFGNARFQLQTVAARLENYVQQPGIESSRYFAIHRLSFQRGRLEGAFSESYLYTGVARGLEFSLVNPLNVYSLSWRNERTDGNLNFGFEGAWRTRTVGTYSAHLLLDDVQIDECETACVEPNSYGITLSAEGLPLFGRQRWFATYTRVTNLTYRTPNPAERYAIYGIGLGRGYSDYDEARVGADLVLFPTVPLKVYVARRRQGEGDYRRPYPDQSVLASVPSFLSGVQWTTDRIGLSGGGSIVRGLQLTGDIGLNRTQNRRHVRNNNSTFLEARVKAIWVPKWLISFH